jgi:hypothetical protein|nr:MAG TPA: hypothetical protein [Caudoviricetes sp.]
MAIAGRVAIVPKGDWSAETEYKRLDEVTYNNTMFIAKKAVPKGTLPTNAEYWSKSIVGGVGAIATKEDAGIVKPADGLSIAEDGTLKVNIDGATLTMDQVNNVIKLADTLKDAINGAFPAANVANNQITTVEGFALDARQANPNIDGTLAKQISDLNGRWSNKNENDLRIDTDHPLMFVKEPATTKELDTPIDVDGVYVCMAPAAQGIVLGYRVRSNQYGAQLWFGHYTSPSYRTLLKGEWSSWKTLVF